MYIHYSRYPQWSSLLALQWKTRSNWRQHKASGSLKSFLGPPFCMRMPFWFSFVVWNIFVPCGIKEIIFCYVYEKHTKEMRAYLYISLWQEASNHYWREICEQSIWINAANLNVYTENSNIFKSNSSWRITEKHQENLIHFNYWK